MAVTNHEHAGKALAAARRRLVLYDRTRQMIVSNPAVTGGVVNELYSVRSSLAHNHYLFKLDEAPWLFNMSAMAARVDEDEIYRSAITVAKTALRNW
jgi:hypothetical protein